MPDTKNRLALALEAHVDALAAYPPGVKHPDSYDLGVALGVIQTLLAKYDQPMVSYTPIIQDALTQARALLDRRGVPWGSARWVTR